MTTVAAYAVLVAVVAALSIRVVKESHRLVVIRLGRLDRVAGPGVVVVVPFVDQVRKVALDETVPEWRGLSSEELRARLFAWYSAPPSSGEDRLSE
jgi:regulator of protease activity HflC (stomatin/prohibitin superfamily)